MSSTLHLYFPPLFLQQFHQVSFFHLYTCVHSICTMFILPHLVLPFPPPTGTNLPLRQALFCPLVLSFCKWKKNFCLFMIDTQGVSLWYFHTYIYVLSPKLVLLGGRSANEIVKEDGHVFSRSHWHTLAYKRFTQSIDLKLKTKCIFIFRYYDRIYYEQKCKLTNEAFRYYNTKHILCVILLATKTTTITLKNFQKKEVKRLSHLIMEI
jgi:hypothetical protein